MSWLKIPSCVASFQLEIFPKNVQFCCHEHGWKFVQCFIENNLFRATITASNYRNVLLIIPGVEQWALAWQISRNCPKINVKNCWFLSVNCPEIYPSRLCRHHPLLLRKSSYIHVISSCNTLRIVEMLIQYEKYKLNVYVYICICADTVCCIFSSQVQLLISQLNIANMDVIF